MLADLHRMLWQPLPPRARRRALVAATRKLAPSLDRGSRPAEPIIVVGALRASTGLGQSARLCYRALAAAGYDVRGIDLGGLFLQPADVASFDYRSGRGCEGPGTLILHVNAPFMPLALLFLGKALLRGKWVIGYWAWELPRVPSDWEGGSDFVHEVWVPSRHTASAVATQIDIARLRVVPHPVAVDGVAVRVARSPSHGDITALVVAEAGPSLARKNPLAAVAAFKRAFGSDPGARLIVKLARPEAFPAGERSLRAAIGAARNITLITETLTLAGMDALYDEADCVLSLHRAEGFGLAIAEAMLRGLPVISTDWSGPTDFLTADHGVPVSYRLVSARDPQGAYDYPDQQWAESDSEAATEGLAALADRNRRAILGRRARRYAQAAFGVESYAATVRDRLAIFPAKPSLGLAQDAVARQTIDD